MVGAIASGSRARLWAKGTATYSAKAPGSTKPGSRWSGQVFWLPDWQAGQWPQARMKGATTRSPTCQAASGPASTTSPQYSWPGIWPGFTRGCSPVQPCQSERQTPQARVRSTTPSRLARRLGQRLDREVGVVVSEDRRAHRAQASSTA